MALAFLECETSSRGQVALGVFLAGATRLPITYPYGPPAPGPLGVFVRPLGPLGSGNKDQLLFFAPQSPNFQALLVRSTDRGNGFELPILSYTPRQFRISKQNLSAPLLHCPSHLSLPTQLFSLFVSAHVSSFICTLFSHCLHFSPLYLHSLIPLAFYDRPSIRASPL